MIKRMLFISVLSFSLFSFKPEKDTQKLINPEIEAKITTLLSKMTLDEKMGQLN